MTAIGQCWHRLVNKYQLFPWCLGVVVDGNSPLEPKRHIIESFLALDDCCQSESFCKPLRRVMGSEPSVEDLLPGGQWHLLLKASFQGLPFNIAVENCFARMKNQQRTCRGRQDITHNLAAKHVLSEVKSSHLASLKQHLESIADSPQSGDADPSQSDQLALSECKLVASSIKLHLLFLKFRLT